MDVNLARHQHRQALAKRRDELLLREAVAAGVVPAAALVDGLAAIHRDGRPVHGPRSSHQVLTALRAAMARDGLSVEPALRNRS